jgi:hypothetical protein
MVGDAFGHAGSGVDPTANYAGYMRERQ